MACRLSRIATITALVAGCALSGVAACTYAEGAAGGTSDSGLDLRGGRLVPLPDLNLRKAGAQWRLTGYADMVFEEGGNGEPPHYRLVTREEDYWDRQTLYVPYAIGLLPNRNYRISMLLDTDFERPAEVNVGFDQRNGAGSTVYARYVGIPNKTDGWQRWECTLTADPQAASGELQIHLWELPAGSALRIADLSVVEEPPVELTPFAKGEGASFLGGPGSLPMQVVDVRVAAEAISVSTTGARYSFDLAENTILAEQLL